LSLNITPFDFEFCNNESTCCVYNEFFILIKEKLNHSFLRNEKYQTDDNFLTVLACIFKTLPLTNLIKHEFMRVIFIYAFQNFNKSSSYEMVCILS
jgi:hypothetical protein